MSHHSRHVFHSNKTDSNPYISPPLPMGKRACHFAPSFKPESGLSPNTTHQDVRQQSSRKNLYFGADSFGSKAPYGLYTNYPHLYGKNQQFYQTMRPNRVYSAKSRSMSTYRKTVGSTDSVIRTKIRTSSPIAYGIPLTPRSAPIQPNQSDSAQQAHLHWKKTYEDFDYWIFYRLEELKRRSRSIDRRKKQILEMSYHQ